MEPAKLLEEDSSGKPKSGEPSPSHTFSGTEMRRDHESVDDFEHLDPESSPIKEAVGEVKSDSLDKLVLLDHQESETTASSSNLESNISPGFSFVSEQKFDHSPKDVSPLPSEDKSSKKIEESEASVLDASDDAKIEIQKSSAEQTRNELEEHHDILKALNDLPHPPTFESVPDVKHDLNERSTDSLPVDNASADVSTSNSLGTESKTEPPEEVSLVSFEPPPIAPVSSISLKRDELVAEEKDLSDKDDDSSFVMAQRDHFFDKNSTEDLVNLSRDVSSNLNVMPSAPLEEAPSESVFSQIRAGITDTHDVFYSDEETIHHQEMKSEESTKTETIIKPDETIKPKPKEEEITPKSQSAVSKESSGDEEFTLLTSPYSWFNPEKLNPRVVQLVYWRNPKESGAVFGSVLAILLSLSYFSLISVVAYLSLCVLCVTLSIRVYKSVLQAIQKNQDGHPFKDLLEMDLTMSEERVQEVTRNVVAHTNAAVTELRRLFLVEDLVDSLKFGVCLWCLTYVGAWFNGMTLIIIAFVGLFTLPKGYENNKAQVDQNLELINKKLSEISAKVKAAIPIGKKEKPKEQ